MRPAGRAVLIGGTVVLAALLLDAAVETVRSGSSVRWWVAAAVAIYFAAAAAWAFRRGGARQIRIGPLALAAAYLLLGLLAATAWLPGGLGDGVRIAGQSTSAVLALISAAAVMLSGWVLYQAVRGLQASREVHIAMRAIGTLVVAYAAAAFLLAARDGTSYAALFQGQSFWRSLPAWLQGAFVGGLVIVPIAVVVLAVRIGVRGFRREPAGGFAVNQALGLMLAVVIAAAGVRLPPPAASTAPVTAASPVRGGPPSSAAGAPVALSAAARTPESYQRALAALERVVDAIARIRAHIDRSQFDLAALEARIGREPSQLIDFVRREVAFEQYPGLLRGAQGTLMSRAGNALDQAVLLATLLERAGMQARIARGTLADSEAAMLVARMAAPRPTRPPLGNVEAIRDIIVGLARENGRNEPDVAPLTRDVEGALESTDLYRAASDDAEFILSTLTREGIPLGDAALQAEMVREAQDYFWVEYRGNTSGQWSAVHPAFEDDESAPQPAAAATFPASAVPQALQHRFRLRVVNEQLVEGRLRTYDAMGWWERPAAALIGTPLTYLNMPSGLKKAEDAGDLSAMFEKTSVFIPMFNSRPPQTGFGFDWEGDTYRLKLLAAGQLQAEQLGRTLTRGLGKLTGALDALSDDPASAAAQGPSLAAQWIEYGLTAPGGRQRIFRRAVLDRLDPTARAAGRFQLDKRDKAAIGAALSRQHTVMLAPGRYPDAYVLDRMLERVVGAKATMAAALRTYHFPGEDVKFPRRAAGEDSWLGHLALYVGFDLGVPAGGVNYRPEPSLAIYAQPLVPTQPAQLSLDIANNTRRAFRVTNGRLVADARDLVRTGAWETHAERMLSFGAEADAGSVIRFNTTEAFRQARAASIGTRVLRPADRAAATALPLPTETTAAIARDLAAGFVVVVPERLPPGATRTGWWRVNPATGETLGMAADGRGSQLVEFLAVLDIVVNLAWARYNCTNGNICSCAMSLFMTGNSGFAFARAGPGFGFLPLGPTMALKTVIFSLIISSLLPFADPFTYAICAT